MDYKSSYLEGCLSYTLMHKDIDVIEIFFEPNGYIKDIGNTYAFNHLPIGSLDSKGNLSNANLIEWWNERRIPISRTGIRHVLDQLELGSLQSLPLRSLGLSLSDQYWINPKNKDISWEEINFFHNDFSDDLGELLLGNVLKNKYIDFSSPDNTSIGNLKKRWKISNGDRILIKGGSNPFRQEPFNEVVAYKVATALGINHVKYSLVFIDKYPYSECIDFISDNEDLVPAYFINKVLKKNNNDSLYTHLIKCGDKLGIKNFKEYLDKLIVFDFIIANEDRHLNNFGVIRDSSTLEFVGPAPIFDSGSSFGFNKISSDIKPFKDIESKPFKSNIIEQLDLVLSFKWLDINKLNYIKDNIYDWFICYESQYLDKARIEAIAKSVKDRIDYITDKYL